ncbi:hypothetical protein BKA62DRAFT_513403 [Auriculariales sp. MPI-PUGE-AT-0066]|nr:hypothetical protein BKA62DRAFT_513403 [Auriculariales sp. MPI-PUGE-AT-0066]
MTAELIPFLHGKFQSLLSEASSPPSVADFKRAHAVLENAVKHVTAGTARAVNTTALINQLPLELLSHTFAFLPSCDRSAAASVCSNWRDAALAPTLWKNLVLSLESDVSRTVPTVGTLLKRACQQDIALRIDLPHAANIALCTTLACNMAPHVGSIVHMCVSATHIPDHAAVDALMDILRYGSVERITTLELVLHTTRSRLAENVLIPLNRFKALRAVSIVLKGPIEFVFDPVWTSHIGALRLNENLSFSAEDVQAVTDLVIGSEELEQINVQTIAAYQHLIAFGYAVQQGNLLAPPSRLRFVYLPNLRYLSPDSISAACALFRARGLGPMKFAAGTKLITLELSNAIAAEWSPLIVLLPPLSNNSNELWYLRSTPELALRILPHQSHTTSIVSAQLTGADGETWIFPRLPIAEADTLLFDKDRGAFQRLTSLAIHISLWSSSAICETPLLRGLLFYICARSDTTFYQQCEPFAHRPFRLLSSLQVLGIRRLESSASVTSSIAPSATPLHVDFYWTLDTPTLNLDLYLVSQFILHQLSSANLPLERLELQDIALLNDGESDDDNEDTLARAVKRVVQDPQHRLSRTTPVPFVFAHDEDLARIYCV